MFFSTSLMMIEGILNTKFIEAIEKSVSWRINIFKRYFKIIYIFLLLQNDLLENFTLNRRIVTLINEESSDRLGVSLIVP